MSRSPSPILASEGVRELGIKFNRRGITSHVTSEGDANSPDYSDIALENLDMVDEDQALQDVAWQRELNRRQNGGMRASASVQSREVYLTATEWDNFAGSYESWEEASDEEIEADSEESEYEFDDDTVGEAVYTDRLSRLADAVNEIDDHVLVRQFGFSRTDLIMERWSDHPRAMEADYLSAVTAACKAADELARLTDDREVVKVIGWNGETPSELSGFGVDLLFRSAGALQARVSEIVESRKPKATVKPGLVLPARKSASPASAPLILVIPSVKPEGSDPFGRISTASGLAFRCVCGCGNLVLESVAQVPPIGAMRERQNGSRIGSKDLWRHAFGERCIRRFGRGYSLKETMRTMMDEELKYQAASRNLRPRFGDVVGNGGATGGSGNGAPAWKLAKMAARAEKDRQIRNDMQSAGKKK